MKIWIGIDPGKDGAIAYITEKGDVRASVFPRIKDEINLPALSLDIAMLTNHKHCFVLEDVHSLFGMSAKANFSFGKNNGHLEGILAAHGGKVQKVAPKKWQKEMFEGIREKRKPGKNGKKGPIDTKAMALLAATRLFPEMDFRKSERAKKAHDGIVDAILMAEYCRRNF